MEQEKEAVVVVGAIVVEVEGETAVVVVAETVVVVGETAVVVKYVVDVVPIIVVAIVVVVSAHSSRSGNLGPMRVEQVRWEVAYSLQLWSRLLYTKYVAPRMGPRPSRNCWQACRSVMVSLSRTTCDHRGQSNQH